MIKKYFLGIFRSLIAVIFFKFGYILLVKFKISKSWSKYIWSTKVYNQYNNLYNIHPEKYKKTNWSSTEHIINKRKEKFYKVLFDKALLTVKYNLK